MTAARLRTKNIRKIGVLGLLVCRNVARNGTQCDNGQSHNFGEIGGTRFGGRPVYWRGVFQHPFEANLGIFGQIGGFAFFCKSLKGFSNAAPAGAAGCRSRDQTSRDGSVVARCLRSVFCS